MRVRKTLALATALSLSAGLVRDHAAHGEAEADAPSTAAYMARRGKIHADMAIGHSGDADVDFAAA